MIALCEEINKELNFPKENVFCFKSNVKWLQLLEFSQCVVSHKTTVLTNALTHPAKKYYQQNLKVEKYELLLKSIQYEAINQKCDFKMRFIFISVNVVAIS